MSYARWSHSCWYVYDNGDALIVEGLGAYTKKDLDKNMETILQSIRDERFDRNPLNYKGPGEPPKDRFLEEEIQELRLYMLEYLGKYNPPPMTNEEIAEAITHSMKPNWLLKAFEK